jgi:predicted acylesterase/phospholipase RssA
VTDDAGQVTYQGEYAAGAVIGEMALVSNLPRLADVFTVHDSIILRLGEKAFGKLCAQFPQLLNKLTQFTVKRLMRSLEGAPATRAASKSVALIPKHPIKHFEARLRTMIVTYPYGEKILLLTEELMRKNPSFFDEKAGMTKEGILWLEHQEEQHSFIFYLAQEELSLWTQFCLRRAQTLAFIVQAKKRDYALSPVEKYVHEQSSDFKKRNYLLLLQDTNDFPQDTGLWLRQRSIHTHHHIRNNTEGDSKIMRLLTEHAVGLVLSGGGARGLAHIGVYRLLQELKVPIDFIAGSSMGSIVAAGIAMDLTPEQGLEIVETVLIEATKMDYTFPYLSIAKGKRVSDGLQKVFGEKTQIENLWIHYFCVSTDMVSRRLITHDQGSLWQSIRASSSLPLIYPPVSTGSQLLVDGAVLNAIPTDVMRQKAPNSRIIASYIADDTHFNIPELPMSVSGWGLLYQKLTHKENTLPITVLDLVHRLITMSSSATNAKALETADSCIFLGMNQFSLLDFMNYKEIYESGYQQAKEQFSYSDFATLKPL